MVPPGDSNEASRHFGGPLLGAANRAQPDSASVYLKFRGGTAMTENDKAAGELHQGQPVLAAGKPLDKARVAIIAVHGRGASAADILSLTNELPQSGAAFL